jgi:hypothetical protein
LFLEDGGGVALRLREMLSAAVLGGGYSYNTSPRGSVQERHAADQTEDSSEDTDEAAVLD